MKTTTSVELHPINRKQTTMFSRIEKKNDIIIFPVTKIHPNKVTNDALERRAKVKDFVKLTIVI